MFAVVITEKGGQQRRLEFDKSEVTIGRVQGNDIILPKGNVSKRHSRIVLKDNRFIVVDLKSTNGTYVNGRKITSPLVVKAGDKIYIGDFILTLEETVGAGVHQGEVVQPPPSVPPPAQPPQQPAALPANAGPPVQPVAPPAPPPGPPPGPPPPARAEPPIEEFAPPEPAPPPVVPPPEPVAVPRPQAAATVAAPAAVPTPSFGSEAPRRPADKPVVVDTGDLGPLGTLIDDASALEILVEGPDRILVDRGQGPAPADGAFASAESLSAIVGRMVTMSGGRFDGGPLQEGTLPGGVHFTAFLPPVAVGGPVVELRRTQRPSPAPDALVTEGVISQPMFDLLRRAAEAGRNVAVVGPTPMVSRIVSAVVNLAGDDQRVVTVERTPSLTLASPRPVRLSAGAGADVSRLIEQAGRLRGDRLAIDGVQGGELLSALLSCASRPGCVLGVHSATGGDPLRQLQALAELGGGAPAAVRRVLAGALQLLVEVEGGLQGRGAVRSVAEVVSDPAGAAERHELVGPNGAVAQPSSF